MRSKVGLKRPPSPALRGTLAVALAAPTPTGIQDPSDQAPGCTQDMARPCSEIRARPLHRLILYGRTNPTPRKGLAAHHATACRAHQKISIDVPNCQRVVPNGQACMGAA